MANNVEMTDEEYQIWRASKAVHLGIKTFTEEQMLLAYKAELNSYKPIGIIPFLLMAILGLILAIVIFAAIVVK